MVNPHRLRSILFVPAIRERFYDSVLKLEGDYRPDAVAFDLEDSVSTDHKAAARELLLAYLSPETEYRKKLDIQCPVILVRTNRAGHPEFEEDCKAVSRIRPSFAFLPKAENSADIRRLRKLSGCGQVGVIIETLAGYAKREAILAELGRGDFACGGYEDLASELGIDRPDPLDSVNPVSVALSNLLLSARQGEAAVFDAVSRRFRSAEDLSALEEECRYSLSLGLSAKLAIHPAQLPVINRAFDKTILLEAARDILARFEAIGDGTSVVLDREGQMLDIPAEVRARKTLSQLEW